MPKTRWGRKWIDFHKGFPRLFLHEQYERMIRWLLRVLTAIGVGTSVLTMPWYWSFTTSLGLLVLDAFLERTLFYYSSLYVDALMENYDPDEWAATVVVSLGEPKDPRSKKIVGLAFKTEEYAKRFFETLHHWNGSSDHRQQDLCMTFIVDEDRYYVYLYSDPEKARIKSFKNKVEQESQLSKYGKEHFPMIMQMIFCHGFETKYGFALGMFLDTNPPRKEFLLAPYTWDGSSPKALGGIEPILMKTYKSKIPFELTQDDYEYYHWHKVVLKKDYQSA